MDFPTFYGIAQIKDLVVKKYNQDILDIRNWWNDHNRGRRIWDVFNATTATITSLTGTTTNNNASAGSVGEYISSSVAVNAVSVTGNTATNIASISLTPGDWQVGGNIVFNTAGTTSFTNLQTSISTTSATQGGTNSRSGWCGTATTFPDLFGITCPTQRLSLSVTTTVYLVGFAVFSVSTLTAGGNLWGLRVR